MELKGLEKSGGGHQRLTPMSPSTRGSIDFEDSEEKVPLHHNTNSLDKTNYLGSYAGMFWILEIIHLHGIVLPFAVL